jgi:hypothetical protein
MLGLWEAMHGFILRELNNNRRMPVEVIDEDFRRLLCLLLFVLQRTARRLVGALGNQLPRLFALGTSENDLGWIESPD